jgi:hypothetical protein
MKPQGLKSTVNVTNRYVLLSLLKHNLSVYENYLQVIIEQEMPQRFVTLLEIEIEKLKNQINFIDKQLARWEADNAMPPSI